MYFVSIFFSLLSSFLSTQCMDNITIECADMVKITKELNLVKRLTTFNNLLTDIGTSQLSTNFNSETVTSLFEILKNNSIATIEQKDLRNILKAAHALEAPKKIHTMIAEYVLRHQSTNEDQEINTILENYKQQKILKLISQRDTLINKESSEWCLNLDKKKLRYLNGIEKLIKEEDRRKITHIQLNNNKLSEIDHQLMLKFFPRLKRVEAAHNFIKKIHNFKPSHYSYWDFSHNQLTKEDRDKLLKAADSASRRLDLKKIWTMTAGHIISVSALISLYQLLRLKFDPLVSGPLSLAAVEFWGSPSYLMSEAYDVQSKPTWYRKQEQDNFLYRKQTALIQIKLTCQALSIPKDAKQ